MVFFFPSSRFALLPSLSLKVGFSLFLRRGSASRSVGAFQKKNKSGGERPAENWFLGRGSKSGQNEMLAVFRWQTRGGRPRISHRFLRGGVFQVGLDLRGRIMLGMRLRRITFSRDFHGLMIPPGTFNSFPSQTSAHAAIRSNIVEPFNSLGTFYKNFSDIHTTQREKS